MQFLTSKNELSIRKLGHLILTIIIIILIFAFFDYLIHSLSEEYSVPNHYFKNKIIFGTAWGILVYFLLSKWKTSTSVKSLFFSILISIILQIRYFYEGYSLDFLIEFLFIHFGILWIVSYSAFSVLSKIKYHAPPRLKR